MGHPERRIHAERGIAYWPMEEALLWKDVASSEAEEVARYRAVIHLHTPPLAGGYDHANPLRIFLTKVARTVALIRDQVPECCRTHRISGVDA